MRWRIYFIFSRICAIAVTRACVCVCVSVANMQKSLSFHGKKQKCKFHVFCVQRLNALISGFHYLNTYFFITKWVTWQPVGVLFAQNVKLSTQTHKLEKMPWKLRISFLYFFPLVFGSSMYFWSTVMFTKQQVVLVPFLCYSPTFVISFRGFRTANGKISIMLNLCRMCKLAARVRVIGSAFVWGVRSAVVSQVYCVQSEIVVNVNGSTPKILRLLIGFPLMVTNNNGDCVRTRVCMSMCVCKSSRNRRKEHNAIDCFQLLCTTQVQCRYINTIHKYAHYSISARAIRHMEECIFDDALSLIFNSLRASQAINLITLISFGIFIR